MKSTRMSGKGELKGGSCWDLPELIQVGGMSSTLWDSGNLLPDSFISNQVGH